MRKAVTGISSWLLFFVLNPVGKMIYYLNFGFIAEQAIAEVVKNYIDRLKLDEIYSNFHISVTNIHPFAHMIIDSNARANDLFPSVVVTSQTENKPSDLVNVPPQTYAIGWTSEDIDDILSLTKRTKTKLNENGEFIEVVKNGEAVKENIPGLVCTVDDDSIAKLKEIADSRTSETETGNVYGIKVDTRRRDHISVEIWSENNQLKNELFEHLRILFTSSLNMILREKFKIFDTNVFDNSVNGERSSNYNFDFDVILNGSHITFEIDYTVSQIIFDTSVTNINEIVTEVKNHVKD